MRVSHGLMQMVQTCEYDLSNIEAVSLGLFITMPQNIYSTAKSDIPLSLVESCMQTLSFQARDLYQPT